MCRKCSGGLRSLCRTFFARASDLAHDLPGRGLPLLAWRGFSDNVTFSFRAFAPFQECNRRLCLRSERKNEGALQRFAVLLEKDPGTVWETSRQRGHVAALVRSVAFSDESFGEGEWGPFPASLSRHKKAPGFLCRGLFINDFVYADKRDCHLLLL